VSEDDAPGPAALDDPDGPGLLGYGFPGAEEGAAAAAVAEFGKDDGRVPPLPLATEMIKVRRCRRRL